VPRGGVAVRRADAPVYRCAGPSCPGLPYRASDIYHPASCAAPAPTATTLHSCSYCGRHPSTHPAGGAGDAACDACGLGDEGEAGA
jgi:hypothetical protein